MKPKLIHELRTLVLGASSDLQFVNSSVPVSPAAPVLLSPLKSAAFFKVPLILLMKSFFSLRSFADCCSLSQMYLYQKEKRALPGNLQSRNKKFWEELIACLPLR
jgi:hypothetical protein